MSQRAPLARVKEEFGGKDKLVDKIVGLLGSTEDESKDDLRRRLLGAANSKLIRLHGVASTVKTKYGTHDKLADATAAQLGRAKDKDYVEKLVGYSSARLLDIARSAQKRGGVAPGGEATASSAASAAAPTSTSASATVAPVRQVKPAKVAEAKARPATAGRKAESAKAAQSKVKAAKSAVAKAKVAAKKKKSKK